MEIVLALVPSLHTLGSRRRLLQRTGKCQLEELGSEVDMEGVVDLIAKGSGKDMQLQDLRRLLALAWGGVPYGQMAGSTLLRGRGGVPDLWAHGRCGPHDLRVPRRLRRGWCELQGFVGQSGR